MLPLIGFALSGARHGADARAEHDLSDLALDHAGTGAGIVSLGGVALGFVFYMLCAAFGITALLFAVPYAYDALRFAGAAYLLWLAWQAVKPGGRSPFQVKKLKVDSPRKLFAMGLAHQSAQSEDRDALSGAAAAVHRSQRGQRARCSRWRSARSRSSISVSVNAMIAFAAGSIALFLGARPVWLLVQRWLMGTALPGFGRMAVSAGDAKRGA